MFAAFFETQPRNRYIDEITLRREQQALIYAALQDSEQVQRSSEQHTVDQFKVAELRAFIEGYITTVTYLVSQDRMNKMPMSDLA